MTNLFMKLSWWKNSVKSFKADSCIKLFKSSDIAETDTIFHHQGFMTEMESVSWCQCIWTTWHGRQTERMSLEKTSVCLILLGQFWGRGTGDFTWSLETDKQSGKRNAIRLHRSVLYEYYSIVIQVTELIM
jgi:hypothetical protein